MEKQKQITLYLGKIFLVFLMVFSQMVSPIEAFALELEGENVSDVTSYENAEVVDAKNDSLDVVDNNSQTETVNDTVSNEEVASDTETTKEETIQENENKNEVMTEEKGTNDVVSDENVSNEEVKEETGNEAVADNEDVTDVSDTVPTTDDSTSLQEQVYTYTVKVNDSDTLEYTLNGDTSVTISQEYDGDEGTYHFSNEVTSIDFQNQLYGDYHYTYSVLSNEDEVLDTKEIVIHYEGNNDDIINEFAADLSVIGGYVGFGGNIRLLTVDEVLSHFDVQALKDIYHADLVVKDANGNVLSGQDNVDVNSKLVLSNGEVLYEVSIFIYDDYNEDGKVDIEDAKIVLDFVLSDDNLDENGDRMFSIFEATRAGFTTGDWSTIPEVKDSLSNSLANRTDVYVGEEFDVTYSIDGFKEDMLNGISGKIYYNKGVLELVDVSANSIYGNIASDGFFAYLLDNYHSEDALITFKFRAIAVGDATISIEDIMAAVLGEKANLDDSISTVVHVTEAGRGGDVEQTVQTPQTTNEVAPTIPKTGGYYYKPIALSSDSLIKDLTIKGYSINFDPHTYEYSIKVKNSVKSLDLTVVLSDPSASYVVNGNQDFKVGKNDVTIVVTAEDGSTSTYTIHVTREKKKAKVEEEKEEKSSSRPIIIVLIILVIIGLIYVIFKDDEEEQSK